MVRGRLFIPLLMLGAAACSDDDGDDDGDGDADADADGDGDADTDGDGDADGDADGDGDGDGDGDADGDADLPDCSGIQPSPGADPALDLVAGGFDHPILLTSPRLDTHRLFVAEQVGAIQIIEDGARAGAPFLDIRARVRQDIQGDDRGLLGLAFHPDYEDNGRFYVSYGDLFGMQRIAEFTVTADPNVADPDSEVVVLDLPAALSHNGGMLQFGPDGMLYASTGDGLPQCTPDADPQDPADLQGKILRLDASVAGEVSVPADNPFGTEAYAVGLRNPWRFGIDFDTGDIWIGDVGYKTWEEVDRIPGGSGGGQNFGWPTLEGPDCNPCRPPNCDIPEGYVAPVQWYDHGEGLSVVGGRVYRGRALPDLDGLFFYADFYTGTVWSVDAADPEGTPETWPLLVSAPAAFGEDACREIYLVSLDGDVYRIAPD